MIGLDTNVLVRYLAQDDAVQSAKASDLIERRLTPQDPGFISAIAMVETVWVLARAYGLAPRVIADAIELILRSDVLVVEHAQEVFASMVSMRDGRGSFADTLIAVLSAKAGCAYTVTFDRKALRLPGFVGV